MAVCSPKAASTSIDFPSSHRGTNRLPPVQDHPKESSLRYFFFPSLFWLENMTFYWKELKEQSHKTNMIYKRAFLYTPGLPDTVGRTLPHQSSIQNTPHRLAYGQSDGCTFSIEVFTPQITLAWVKLTKN